MPKKEAPSSYWWDKLRHADFLVAEKEATARRMEHEAKLLRKRRERIAKSWREAVKREEGEQVGTGTDDGENIR